MEIRRIQKDDDRFAISHIYEEGWKYAYKDIVPQSYLDSIPHGQWASKVDQEGVSTLVLIENDTLIGTSSCSKSRFAEFDSFGEIISIYLLPQYIGKGYGRPLLEAAIDELVKLGYSDIFLWVLEENKRARKFYEKVGFTFSNHCLDDNIGGKELREMQYCYHAKQKNKLGAVLYEEHKLG